MPVLLRHECQKFRTIIKPLKFKSLARVPKRTFHAERYEQFRKEVGWSLQVTDEPHGMRSVRTQHF